MDDIISGKFFGLAKVDIEPPKNLYVPVLPDNSNGKLLFHLDNMTEKSLNTNSEISANEQIDGNCYSCDFCEKKFTRKDSLNKHIKSSCKNKKTDNEIINMANEPIKENEQNEINYLKMNIIMMKYLIDFIYFYILFLLLLYFLFFYILGNMLWAMDEF